MKRSQVVSALLILLALLLGNPLLSLAQVNTANLSGVVIDPQGLGVKSAKVMVISNATGGVINIVTKNGGNDFHGDAFGFFRNKAFQARNSFSGQVDPATGILEPVKQAYTRTQSGLTIGGPLKKDKTFFFGSYEYTQREETGFSSIGIDNFGLAPCGPGCGPLNGLQLTSDQSAAVQQLLGQGQNRRSVTICRAAGFSLQRCAFRC